MIALWAIFFLLTPFDYLLIEQSFYDAYVLIQIPVLMFFTFAWFVTDARNLDIQPSYGLKIGVVFLSIIFIPFYLVKYKGWKKSLVSFGKFFALLIPLIIYDALFEYYYYYNA